MNRTPRPHLNRGSDWWVRVLRGWASNGNLRRRHVFRSKPSIQTSTRLKNHTGTFFFFSPPVSVMRRLYSLTLISSLRRATRSPVALNPDREEHRSSVLPPILYAGCYLFHWLLATSKHRNYSLAAFPPSTEHREKKLTRDSYILTPTSNSPTRARTTASHLERRIERRAPTYRTAVPGTELHMFTAHPGTAMVVIDHESQCPEDMSSAIGGGSASRFIIACEGKGRIIEFSAFASAVPVRF